MNIIIRETIDAFSPFPFQMFNIYNIILPLKEIRVKVKTIVHQVKDLIHYSRMRDHFCLHHKYPYYF